MVKMLIDALAPALLFPAPSVQYKNIDEELFADTEGLLAIIIF